MAAWRRGSLVFSQHICPVEVLLRPYLSANPVGIAALNQFEPQVEGG